MSPEISYGIPQRVSNEMMRQIPASAITAMIKKELWLLARDPGGLVMLFVLPAVFIVVLSVALQGAFSSGANQERIQVLVVDQGSESIADALVDFLQASDSFQPLVELEGQPLTRDRATSRIRSGEVDMAVVVPANGEQALALEWDETLEVLVDPVLSEEITLALVGAVQQFVDVVMIEGMLRRSRAMTQALESLAPRPGVSCPAGARCDLASNRDAALDVCCQSTNYYADRGLLVRRTPVGSDDNQVFPTVVQQNVPGWTIFALFWIAQLLCLNLLEERSSGAYKRILVSPISAMTYLGGKVIPFVLVNLIQAVAMFAIGIYLLPLLGCGELVLNNVGALALLTLAVSLVSIGFGVLMASISKSVLLSSSVCASVLIIMAVLGGIMVPKFVMPAVMQRISLAVPHGWALDAYQDVLVRGADAVLIMPQLGVLLLFAVVFFTAGAWRIDRRR